MEENENRYLLVFDSYNQAIVIYKKLLKKGCRIEFISTPCTLSKGCSKSIVFLGTDTKTVVEEVKKYNVNIKGIYKIVNKDNRVEYVHI